MGIRNLEYLIDKGGNMSDTSPRPGGDPPSVGDPQKDESPSPALPVNPDQPAVDDPDLPEEGDDEGDNEA